MLRRKPIDMDSFIHLYPFESHYMNINGFNYHYVDEGSGEPVVMVHGNPTWSFYYRKLIDALSDRYRTIVPDHIGCGLSDKPDGNAYDYKLINRVDDLEVLIDNLRIKEKITLVLHDWGGFIGMAYAIRHPQGKPIPIILKFIRGLKPFAVLAVQGFNLFAVGALYKNSFKGLPGEVRAGLVAPYNCWQNRIATLKFVQDIHLTEKNPSYSVVKQVDASLSMFLDMPVLICWGAHDFVFDHDYLAEWQRRFPEAEVHHFPDAGHYILEDIPDRVIPLVEDFLTRHPIENRGQ